MNEDDFRRATNFFMTLISDELSHRGCNDLFVDHTTCADCGITEEMVKKFGFDLHLRTAWMEELQRRGIPMGHQK